MIAEPDLAMAIHCIIIAAGGLITNGCLLIVIISNKELRRKDYICFILNRTLLDFTYCLLLGGLHPLAILTTTPTSTLCKTAALFEVGLASASIYVEPILTCNRYVSIFYRNIYKKVYTTRNVYLMCVLAWVVGFGCSGLPHVIAGSLGRVTGIICCINFTKDTLLVTLLANYLFLLSGLFAVGFFNYKIFRFLHKHQSQTMTNKQKSKLQNDKEMSRFIIVVAFLPVVFQVPAVVGFWVRMFAPISEWIMFSTTAFFMISFIINPMVTLSMVRPLRNQFKKSLRRILGQTAVVSAFDLAATTQYQGQTDGFVKVVHVSVIPKISVIGPAS